MTCTLDKQRPKSQPYRPSHLLPPSSTHTATHPSLDRADVGRDRAVGTLAQQPTGGGGGPCSASSHTPWRGLLSATSCTILLVTNNVLSHLRGLQIRSPLRLERSRS